MTDKRGDKDEEEINNGGTAIKSDCALEEDLQDRDCDKKEDTWIAEVGEAFNKSGGHNADVDGKAGALKLLLEGIMGKAK